MVEDVGTRIRRIRAERRGYVARPHSVEVSPGRAEVRDVPNAPMGARTTWRSTITVADKPLGPATMIDANVLRNLREKVVSAKFRRTRRLVEYNRIAVSHVSAPAIVTAHWRKVDAEQALRDAEQALKDARCTNSLALAGSRALGALGTPQGLRLQQPVLVRVVSSHATVSTEYDTVRLHGSTHRDCVVETMRRRRGQRPV